MIRAEEIDADGHFPLDGENVELEQILLGLQAQCHAFVSKDLHGFHPGAGGEVVVVALLGQEVNKKLQMVPRHVKPQVAQLHQFISIRYGKGELNNPPFLWCSHETLYNQRLPTAAWR